MLKIIKKYIDILGGIITAAILSLVANWELIKIQLIYSVIILMLVLIGMFKVVIAKYNEIHHLKKQRDSSVVDKLIDNQKPMKAIRFSQKPTKDGEELGQLICETFTKKGTVRKKMIKWIKRNKGALTSCLIAVIGLLELVFGWLVDYIPFPISFNVVGVAITVCALVVSVLTSGFGSTKFKEALAQLKDQLNGDKTDLDQINSIKYLERQVEIYNKEITALHKSIDDLAKTYKQVLEDVKTCQALGLNLDETTYVEYEKYKNENKGLQDKLASKKGALEIYLSKLNQIKPKEE